MKKRLFLLASLALILGACSNVSSSSLSDEDDVSFVQNGDEWTGFYKNDGYEAFRKMA